MAITLTSTKDSAALNGLKFLVHGPAGAGKTSLCATTGEPTVIISAESGLLSLRGVDIPVIEVKTLDQLYEAYDFVVNTEQGQAFKWVCLDSISEIAEVVLNHEKKVAKDPRQAYGALAEKMTDLIRAFRDLPGRNVYFSCKQERAKDEQSGAMLYYPAMPGNMLKQGVGYFFDFVFALRIEKDADGNPTRWLQTSRDYNYEAKDRSGSLEMFESPNLSAIAAKVISTTAK
jgi:phage nucleotide-binding protein